VYPNTDKVALQEL